MDVAGSAERPPVGTEHLLLGLTLSGAIDPGAAVSVLAATDLTFPVLISVLRRRAGRPEAWQSDDSTGEGRAGEDGNDRRSLGELDRYPPRRPIRYTPAARAALHRAAGLAAEQGHADVDRDHLLRGLLVVDDNRAAELIRVCGVEPARLRTHLAGGAPVTTADDPVAPELRPTRDAVLGHAGYHTDGLAGRLLAAMLRWVPLAEAPVAWVQLEAREQARRLRQQRVGTEHLVLAVLAAHEILRCYPHLRPDGPDHARYAGGEVLAEAGITYRDAEDAVRQHPDGLGTDARAAPSYIRRRWRSWRPHEGTGQLLLAVLTQDDSRGANLLRLLGQPPARIRARLRARFAGG